MGSIEAAASEAGCSGSESGSRRGPWFHRYVEPRLTEPIDECASERDALRLRNRGATYEAIGQALGFSRGKAHHLVRAGQKRAVDDAYEVARPPGRSGERTRERGSELLGRLDLDFRRVHRVLENHLDLDGESSNDAAPRLRVASLEADFAEGWGRLAERLAGLDTAKPRDRKRGGADSGLCRSVRRSFVALLRIAAEADAVLRDQVRETFVVAVFGRDLAELAEILEIECPPAPPLPTDSPGLESGAGAGESNREEVTLDRDARRRRNERIVTARVGGASVTEVARVYGLSTRQVCRIMAEHRSGRRVAPPAVLEAMDEAVCALRRDLRDIDERTDDAEDSVTRVRLCAERLSLVDGYVSVLSMGGWLSAEAWVAARKNAAALGRYREEFASEANERLRRLLKEHDVAPEVIELALDEVLIAAGLEEWLH